MDPVLIQINSLCNFELYLFKIYFNIILPPTPVSPKCSLQVFQQKICVNLSYLLCVLQVPRISPQIPGRAMDFFPSPLLPDQLWLGPTEPPIKMGTGGLSPRVNVAEA